MPEFFVLCEACGQVNRVSNAVPGSTIRCKGCQRPVPVTEENRVPLGPGDPDEPPMEIVYGDGENEIKTHIPRDGNHCEKCGRRFRGDWDRNQTAVGLLCHICANQTRDPDPEFMAPTGDPVDNELPFADFKPVHREEEEPHQKTQFEENMRKVAIAGAILVVGLAIFFAIFDPQPDVQVNDDGTVAAVEMEQVDIPTFVYVIAYILQFVSGIVPHFIALYLILSWTANLPNDDLWKNIIALGVIAVVLAAINMVPCFGIILAAAFVMYMYRLDWREAFLYLILTSLAHILVWIANHFILGGLVYIFT